MSELGKINQQVLAAQSNLVANLHELDRNNFAVLEQRKLTPQEYKMWYYQHVLVKAVQAFVGRQELVLPKHMATYDACFSNDIVLMKLSRKLLMVPNVDQLILKSSFDDLMLATKTQNLHVQAVDEISQWRLRVV